MERHLTNLWTNQKGEVVLQYRSWDGDTPLNREEEVQTANWYFCIKTEDLDQAGRLAVWNLVDEVTADGEFSRIYCQNLGLNRWDRERGMSDAATKIAEALSEAGIQTYEADITPHYRYLIENNLKMATKFKTLFYDIETDDRGDGIEVGRDRIISYAAMDQTGKTFYYSGDEKKLLEHFHRTIEDYDLISGWNSDRFDGPYLRKRAQQLGVKFFTFYHTQQVDLLQRFQELYHKDQAVAQGIRSYKLENVATYFLGSGKIPRTSTWEMFMNAPDKLKEYNIRDVEILKQLEEKLGIIAQDIVKGNVLNSHVSAKVSGAALDLYAVHFANGRGVHLKTTPRLSRDSFSDNSYVGGHVFEPIVGLHHDVITLDAASLYPSQIRTYNISPETYIRRWNSGLLEPEDDGPFVKVSEPEDFDRDTTIASPAGYLFKKEFGIIPSLVDYLVNWRNEIRKGRMAEIEDHDSPEYKNLYYIQYSVKTMANGLYGVLGSPMFRFYSTALAEAITIGGHHLIRSVSEMLSARGNPTIYGDTDSVFVQLKHGDNPVELENYVNKEYAKIATEQFGVERSYLKMEYEKKFETLLMVSKKRYAGLLSDGTFVLQGLEAKKRDTIKFTADQQMNLIQHLLESDLDIPYLHEYVKHIKNRVMTGDVPRSELVVYKKLTKDPKEFSAYKKGGKLPFHCQIYLDFKDKYEELQVGSYIPAILTSGKPLTGVPPDEPDDYDRDYYWNNRVFPPLYSILKIVAPDEDWAHYEIVPAALLERRKKMKLKKENPELYAELYPRKTRKQKIKQVKVELTVDGDPQLF